MKQRDRCHKLLSLAVKRHYATLMMTFIKLHKASPTPNEDAASLAVRCLSSPSPRSKSASCNKKSIAPKRLTGAWPRATLNYTTAPQITQMEVILQSEVTVSTMDVLSLQRWPEESESINEACCIIFQSPPLPPLSVVFAHMHNMLSLCISLSLSSRFGSQNNSQRRWQKSTNCNSYSHPSAR